MQGGAHLGGGLGETPVPLAHGDLPVPSASFRSGNLRFFIVLHVSMPVLDLFCSRVIAPERGNESCETRRFLRVELVIQMLHREQLLSLVRGAIVHEPLDPEL